MSDETHPLGWWTISGEALLDLLRRAHSGEHPDLLYMEEYANADVCDPNDAYPDADWFHKVDEVTSLIAHRRYGLDDDLADALKQISREARQYAAKLEEDE